MVNKRVSIHQVDLDGVTTVCGIFLLDTEAVDQCYPTEAKVTCDDCRCGLKGLIIE